MCDSCALMMSAGAAVVVVVHGLGLGWGRDDSAGEDKTGGGGQKKKSHDVSLCFLFLP